MASAVRQRNKKAPAVAAAAADSSMQDVAATNPSASAALPSAAAAAAAGPPAPPPRRRLTEVEQLAYSKFESPAPRGERKDAYDTDNQERPACSLAYELEDGGVPVFKPTWDEFKSFARFIELVEPVGSHYGAVKVIPPPEFCPSKSGYSAAHIDGADGIKIHNPARQKVLAVPNYSGAFRVKNEDSLDEHKNVELSVSAHEFQAQALAAEAKRSKSERDMIDARDWEGLERAFWRGTLSHEPLYGADSAGSLFDDADGPWNVGHLPSLLHVMPDRQPGIDLPFLYWGTWKSMFCWHREDVNLYSINYLHFGKPKQWYVLKPRDGPKLDELVQRVWFVETQKECKDFMRHKEALLSPALLKSYRVPFAQTRQMPGQYMVLWPAAYHAGFNYGVNCAESVNFATRNWLEEVQRNRCSKCLCEGYPTVWIDVSALRARARKLQWLYRQEQAQGRQPATGPSGAPLTLSDVPSDYQLDMRSMWLDLPVDTRELTALRMRYFTHEADGSSEEDEDDRQTSGGGGGGGGGRSMTGRSMAGRSMSGRAAAPSVSGGGGGYAQDANALFCTYADCIEPLHPNQFALMKHYREAHVKREEAADTRPAAAAAATSVATAASSAAAMAASSAKSGSSKVSGAKRSARENKAGSSDGEEREEKAAINPAAAAAASGVTSAAGNKSKRAKTQSKPSERR